MPRFFDIRPPKKSKLTKKEKKRQKKSNAYFIFFLILIGAFFIAFLGVDKLNLPKNPSSPSPIAAVSPKTSGIKTQKNLSIKLLNGTGRYEETQNVTSKLTDSGFTLTTTENALNLYDQSIIYFQPPYGDYAKQIAAVLSSYNPTTQQFSQSTVYNILIVIGSK